MRAQTRVTRNGEPVPLAVATSHASVRDKPLRELTVADVEELITSMLTGGKRNGEPYGKWAVRAAVGRLSQALDRAVRHKDVTENVAKQVGNLPKDKRGKRRTFDYWKTSGHGGDARVPNFDKFRAVADRHRDAGAWRLTLCGMTRADIMGLMWSDINLNTGKLEVERGRVIVNGNDDYAGEPKSEQHYSSVFFENLEPGTITLLRRMKARQAEERFAAGSAWRETGCVVVNEIGEPLRPELYSDRFRALCRSAGVPVIHLHKVRRSLAGLLHEQGWTPANAAKLLGHTKDVHIASYLPDADDESYEATAERLKVKRQAASADYGIGGSTRCTFAVCRAQLVTERREPRAWFYEARGLSGVIPGLYWPPV